MITSRERLLWVIIGAAILSGLAYHAWPAPSSKMETPLSTTQSHADAKKPPARCLQANTIQRFSVKPDGKMEYLGGFTMWTACEK